MLVAIPLTLALAVLELPPALNLLAFVPFGIFYVRRFNRDKARFDREVAGG